MIPHVQWSTNFKLGSFKNKTNFFLCTNHHFFSGLATAQAVDPLPLYRDFPDWSKELLSVANIFNLTSHRLFHVNLQKSIT
jgi:hypothetical protein